MLQGDLGSYFPASGDFMRQKYAIAGAIWSHSFSSKSFLTVRPYYIHVDALQSMNNSGMIFFGGPYWLSYISDQSGLTLGYTSQLNEKQMLKIGGSVLASDNNLTTYIDRTLVQGGRQYFPVIAICRAAIQVRPEMDAEHGRAI